MSPGFIIVRTNCTGLDILALIEEYDRDAYIEGVYTSNRVSFHYKDGTINLFMVKERNSTIVYIARTSPYAEEFAELVEALV